MNTELTTLNEDTSKADIFFGQKPVFTDWDYYLANPGSIKLETVVKNISDIEPVGIASPHMANLFVWQQLIRLSLRHKKHLPLTLERTCPDCGIHKMDAVLSTCLHCHETNFLLPGRVMGNHSGHRFIILFDPKSGTWGMQFRYGYGRDKYIMLVVIGYKTRMDAKLAFYPVVLYNLWLQRQTKGMSDTGADDLIDLDTLMRENLPLTPLELENLLRKQINADMQEERSYYASTINAAIRDYESEHSQ
jgi:hypothetical protein